MLPVPSWYPITPTPRPQEILVSVPGALLCLLALMMFLAGVVSIYSTTMTVKRSRVAPWAIALVIIALVLGTIGIILLVR